MRPIAHMGCLQAKAAALLILKRRFYPHASAIATQVVPSSSFVADHHQRDLLAKLPGRRQPRLTLMCFPEPDPSLPGLSRLAEDPLERLPEGLALRIEL